MLSFKDVPVPFIFIHIPKTAGTSIKKVLKDNGYGYSLKPNRNSRRIFRNPGHFRIKHYKHFMNLYPVGFTFEDAFKFSVIRNPFERVVSYYYFIRQKNKAYKREYTDENFHSWFERVLIGGEPDISNRPKNVDTLVPCTHFLTEPINQILRFENLKEDFALLKKNLRLEIILPHENKIEHPCYKNHITTSERAWIEKISNLILRNMDMSGNLGVYIICKNEEKLIRHCVEPVLKVFPQVKVIDLGSQDATLDILKDLGVQVTGISCTPGQYSDLKNDLAKSHEWVIHIDGDEIFTIENLQKMNTYVNEYGKTHAWRALRVGWNDLKCIHRRIYVSSNINGPKLYRPSKFNFIGDWPTEVLHGPRKKKYRQAKEDCDIWCWHGRFLERSSIRDSSREEKIKTYQSRFNYQWRYLGRKLPWNTK